MLTTLGIPMEQLRGRTKEELVEMLVSVKGKMGGQERPEVEEEVVEEEVVRAAHGGRIGLTGGQLVKPGPGRQGYAGMHDETEAAGKSYEEATSPGGEGGEAWQQRALQQFKTLPTTRTGPKTSGDGIITKFKDWQDSSNLPKRTKFIDDLLYTPGMREKLLGLGIIKEGEEGQGEEDFYNWQWAGNNPITSGESLTQLQGLGYKGGIPTPSSGRRRREAEELRLIIREEQEQEQELLLVQQVMIIINLESGING